MTGPLDESMRGRSGGGMNGRLGIDPALSLSNPRPPEWVNYTSTLHPTLIHGYNPAQTHTLAYEHKRSKSRLSIYRTIIHKAR